MSEKLFHSQSGYAPVIIPYLGDTDRNEIDRAQELDLTVTLTQEKIEELGTSTTVAWIKDVPVTGGTLRQLEYGEIDFFLDIANQAAGTASITLSEVDNTAFDICAYLTDVDGTFKGTIWLPKQRLTGFSINIADPTATIERSFEFTGEDAILLQEDNKYLIFQTETVDSGELSSGNDFVVTVNDPAPVEDPDNSGVYIFRVVRVRSGVTTELTTSDYSFSAPSLTISSAQNADVYKIWYSSGSYVSGGSVFTSNSSDAGAYRAKYASLYIGTANYLYRVQSATIDVRLTREDVREIGNEDVVLRGVSDATVTITLGQLINTSMSLEEICRGVASTYGKIDAKQMSTNLTFICAIFSSTAKGEANFKIGYKATTLTPSEWKPGTGAINAHVSGGFTLVGEYLQVTTTWADLGIS